MALSDEMRRLTGHFVEAYDDRAAAVADIHTTTAQELAEAHTAHQAMAAEQHQWLTGYVDGLHRDTAVFFKELDSAQQAMVAEQRQCLTEYVSTLESGTATMLGDFRTAHQAMAEEQYQRLAAERAGLGAERAGLASDVAAMRGRLQVDLSKARQAWSSFARQMQERRATDAPPPREKVASDDLTAIRGIGSGTQRHLNEARIFTYIQLAESTPEELRQILGEGAQAAKAGEWIKQAQGLVE